MKSLLTTFAAQHPECNLPSVSNVAVFASKYHTPAPVRPASSVPHYSERATGAFTLPVRDEELAVRFRTIQEHIRCLKP